MRAWRLVLMVGSLAMMLAMGRAQTISAGRVAPAGPSRDLDGRESESDGRHRTEAAVGRLSEHWRFLRQRLPQDPRLRALSRMVGVGVLTYEGIPGRRKLPLAAIGTQALQMGLHPQLHDIRERSGFDVEPSIGHRRFVLTLRKAF